ncbi:unnamed protein product [Protopolystoma xenopodis]|uniref:Uncharacterized protein n=1 Tax=Protopolystoma xenopodis TaxID=117903 RepID=A0A448X6S4_9PLAT|nr:unnamed protein product [Protopolystoma xenopodis]
MRLCLESNSRSHFPTGSTETFRHYNRPSSHALSEEIKSGSEHRLTGSCNDLKRSLVSNGQENLHPEEVALLQYDPLETDCGKREDRTLFQLSDHILKSDLSDIKLYSERVKDSAVVEDSKRKWPSFLNNSSCFPQESNLQDVCGTV